MELFTLFFVCVFIYVIFKGIHQFIENENSPILSERAYVERKITDTSIDANNIMNTTLTIVFNVNNNRIKCVVTNRIYKQIPENVYGNLTHQGTRFKKFEFNGNIIEK